MSSRSRDCGIGRGMCFVRSKAHGMVSKYTVMCGVVAPAFRR